MIHEVKVTRYVRAVLDGQLVVRRPGDRVAPILAARLGLIPLSEVPRVIPPGAMLPAAWREET